MSWPSRLSSSDTRVRRTCDIDREIEALRRVNPACEHVVGVARPGDCAVLDRAAMLLEGQDIGHDLTGMRPLGKAVNDRHFGVERQFGKLVMIEHADDDGIDEARQNPRCIGDRFAAAELHFLAGQHDRFAAKFAHPDVEGNARAGRGFVENHRQDFAGQRPLRRELALAATALDRAGDRRIRRNSSAETSERSRKCFGADAGRKAVLITRLRAARAWPAQKSFPPRR